MNTQLKGHNYWIITGKDSDGMVKKCRYLYYNRREAIKRFREENNCVGKHGVIHSVVPQFGWY